MTQGPEVSAAHVLPAAGRGNCWVPVAHGESGAQIFRLSTGEAFAKVERTGLLADERDRTAWFAGTGLQGPRVLDWIEKGERACLVTSAVAGVPADTLSPAALLAAWPSLCEALRAIHELPAAPCPFDRRVSKMFERASDVVSRNAVTRVFLPRQYQAADLSDLLAKLRDELPARLAQEEQDLVVCHGDACLPNFLVDPDTNRCTGVVDLGRLGLADRYADLALTIANAAPHWLNDENATAADKRLFAVEGIAVPDRDRLAFYALLDALTWG